MKLILRTIIILMICIFSWANGYAYTPPKGIPNPSDYFSTFGEIDQVAPSVATTNNPKCTNWPSAPSTGCYYIDKTSGSASDSGNTNGYPDKPRVTLPDLTALTAGSLVYINAGTYHQSLSVGGTGTASNPIWIIGNPSANPSIIFWSGIGGSHNASYIVVDNLKFSGAAGQLNAMVNADNITVDHIIIRNCVFEGGGTYDDGDAIFLGSHETRTNSSVQYVVIYNNSISGYGGNGSEIGGIYHQKHTSNIWELDNVIHGLNGADGIAGSHTALKGEEPTNIFIGRNTIYNNGENGIDLKGAKNIIISENTIYGPFLREQGWAIVLHYGAAGNGGKNIWVLFNKLYHLSGGVVTTDGEDIYYVGNLIYDISDTYGVDSDPFYSGACMGSAATGSFYSVDNTCYDAERGVSIYNGELSGKNDIQISGNIISNRKLSGRPYDIYINADTGRENVVMGHNRFSSGLFYYGGSKTLSQIQTSSNCTTCSEGEIGLSNPPTSFTLAVGSPCVGANTEHTVYELFTTTWAALGYPGLSIKKDYAGTLRPQNTTWDIGAYEYSGTAINSFSGGSFSGGTR